MGVLYWDHGVVGHTELTHDTRTLNSFLDGARIAGGTNEFADLGNIRIIRKTGNDLLTIRVRVVDALRGSGGRLSTNDIPQILSGDTLVVP